MNKILCSTGAITGEPNGYDYKILEPLSKQLTCDGFELMIDSEWYKDIGEKISKGGDDEVKEAFRLFDTNCDVAKSIGADRLVLHLWGGGASDSNFQSNLNAYQCLNEIASNYGLDLLVENVVCNVENPMKHLCELKEKYPKIQFVFDTKMAAFHAQLELLYVPEYEWLWKEGRIRHYHVNDYGGGYMDWCNLRTLPIGRGKVDFEKFFSFIKVSGYRGDYTVEATAFDDEGGVDVDMLNEQFRCIREWID